MRQLGLFLLIVAQAAPAFAVEFRAPGPPPVVADGPESGEKAALFKLLGILKFAQGLPDEARKNLEAALLLDPQLTMTRAEAVDEGVLPLFVQLGGKVAPDEPVAAAPPEGAVPADPAIEAAAADALDQRLAATGKLIREDTTRIVIELEGPPVDGVHVFVDGLIAGKAGDEIDVAAGPVVVEVGAPGYASQRLMFDAAAGEKTVRRVALPQAPDAAPKAPAR